MELTKRNQVVFLCELPEVFFFLLVEFFSHRVQWIFRVVDFLIKTFAQSFELIKTIWKNVFKLNNKAKFISKLTIEESEALIVALDNFIHPIEQTWIRCIFSAFDSPRGQFGLFFDDNFVGS
jgi:hypothetical protein